MTKQPPRPRIAGDIQFVQRRQLGAYARERLRALAHKRHWEDGDVLLRAGEIPKSVIAIEQGLLRISQVAADGSEHLHAAVQPGALMGLGSVVGQLPMGFTVVAQGACTSIHYDAQALLALMRQDGEVALELAAVLARWGQEQRNLAVEKQLLPLIGRLHTALRMLRLQGVGRAVAGGFELRITQYDIACMLGSSRQYINPQLRQLQQMGIVRLGYRTIVLLDEPG